MPSKRQYDLVLDDGPDSKIPLHNEEAFQHGIHFCAKYIGTLDVPRPTSRVEIVAAMRRIRYEFKAKAVKKKKVSITVSVDGVKVILQKKNRRITKQQQWNWDENHNVILQHPIYRIFYVSHDSQDLKIFSYIARDSSTNVFRCNVFKAYKKNQAMNMVRTIGQAFEVCHRLSLQTAVQSEEGNDGGSEKSSEGDNDPTALQSNSTLEKPPLGSGSSPSENGTSTSTQSPEDAVKQTQLLLDTLSLKPLKAPVGSIASPVTPPNDPVKDDGSMNNAFAFHRIQLLRQQLQLQAQQTQFVLAQMQHLKDQLAAETAARVEAQAQTHQLLLQNRELVAHVNALVNRLVQLESSADNVLNPDQQHSPNEISNASNGSILDPSFLFVSASSDFMTSKNSSLFQLTDYKMDQKDGVVNGHKDTSPGCLAFTDNPIDRWLLTANDGQNDSNDQKHLGLDSRNGITINNMFLENKNLDNGDNHGDVINDVQDPTGNKVELNIAPKLDPPPKVNRNSTRISAPVTSVAINKPVIIGLDLDFKPNGQSEMRFAVEDKTNETDHRDLNLLPILHRDMMKKSPDKLLDPVSSGNNNESDATSSSPVASSGIHSLKGIKNRFAIQHQSSIDSTAKLKLSFSDNE